jgi:hypothetical protein
LTTHTAIFGVAISNNLSPTSEPLSAVMFQLPFILFLVQSCALFRLYRPTKLKLNSSLPPFPTPTFPFQSSADVAPLPLFLAITPFIQFKPLSSAPRDASFPFRYSTDVAPLPFFFGDHAIHSVLRARSGNFPFPTSAIGHTSKLNHYQFFPWRLPLLQAFLPQTLSQLTPSWAQALRRGYCQGSVIPTFRNLFRPFGFYRSDFRTPPRNHPGYFPDDISDTSSLSEVSQEHAQIQKGTMQQAIRSCYIVLTETILE